MRVLAGIAIASGVVAMIAFLGLANYYAAIWAGIATVWATVALVEDKR